MAVASGSAQLTAEDLAEAYSLHPSDHPGLLLVSKMFDGNGFGSWKRAMSIALSTKGKLFFIDGSLTKPAANDLKKWIKCNDMVMAWILNVLTKDIGDSIIYAKSARDMWLQLEERYGQANGAKFYQVQKEICNISQGSSDIAAYFTKIKTLWDEISDLDDIPVCACASADKILKREEKQKLIQFLMGLNDSYSVIRGNILMMNPLPSIGQVYSMLTQEEKQREVQATTHFLADSASLSADVYRGHQTGTPTYKRQAERIEGQPSGNPGGFRRSERSEGNKAFSSQFCNYCKKPGHLVDKCYKLHGFPPSFKFTKGRRVVAHVQHHEDTSPNEQSASSQHSNLVVPGLSPEQSSQLVSLLTHIQLSKGSSSTSQALEDAKTAPVYANFAGKVLCDYSPNVCLSSVFQHHPGSWIIDTGANDHICYQKHLFLSLNALCKPCKVTLPNGEFVEVLYSGKVVINKAITLHEVLYAPTFKYNLLSISKLCKQDHCLAVFTEDSYLVQAPSLKKLQVLGRNHGGLYLVEPTFQSPGTSLSRISDSYTDVNNVSSIVSLPAKLPTACTSSAQPDMAFVWHARLRHLSFHKLQKLGLLHSSSSTDLIKMCPVCSKARQHRLPFPHSQIHTTHVFELIHIDLWGPYRVQTYNGYKYFMTIVDDYSRSTWTHLLSCKSNALSLIKAFVEMVQTQYHASVQTIRSDNAFELGSSHEATIFFLSKGIVHQSSCVGTPQQNGVVERKHKHLLKTARALLFQSGLPLKYWEECVLAATYLINRFPSKVLKGSSPYQLLCGESPTLTHLKVFGCLCYASTLKAGRDKFQARAVPCVFLGYPFGQKAYKLLNLETHTVFVSRDVIFHEWIFPYNLLSSDHFPALFPFHNFFSSHIDLSQHPASSTSQQPTSTMTSDLSSL